MLQYRYINVGLTRKDLFMTKKRLYLLLFFLTLLFLTSCAKNDYDLTNKPLSTDNGTRTLTHILNPDAEVRGVWIASVYNIDYPSKTDLSADKLKAEIDSILATCEKNQLNTVFFQVRPSCDALYNSELFPVSSYISTSGELSFDPLEYIVTEGHKRNIRIHAWINPLRVTMSTHDLESLPENSPARQNPDWVVPYADGKLYLNAGIPEVHRLISDGVAEIVRNYDVDGIVFDDYFYPYPVNDENGLPAQFDDADAFEKYGEDYSDYEEWRRDNINKIVKMVYDTVHSIDDECLFGISPFAIWQNNNGTNGGSDTNGFESYNSLYCDALAWIEGGYIDYISPQIYWTFENSSAPFDVLTRWWNAALDGTDVKLYISHASYRYEEGEWDSPEGQLTEQIAFARSEKYYRGSVFYGYDEINRNIRGASDDIIQAYRNEIIYTDIVSNGRAVEVTSPANGSTTTESRSYIMGLCDPYYPLTVTGGGLTKQKVSQTKSGYFNLYVTLSPGENIFRFEQNGEEYIYSLYYNTLTAANPPTNSEVQPVILDSLSAVVTYPTSDITTSEDILWVSCTAPYGSDVTVDIGGVTTTLVPLETPSKTWSADGYIGVSYGINAALPEASKNEILECGTLQFNVSHANGNASTEGVRVRALGEGAMLCVRIKDDYTELKITESSSYYNDYTVQSAGMIDYAVSQRAGFYRLRMGGYVAEADVEEITDPALYPAEISTITAASVVNAGKTTEFRISCNDRPAYNGCIEKDRFVVTFYNIDPSDAPLPLISQNPLLKSCEIVDAGSKVRYSFELYAVENFYGFDLRYEDGATIVSLRNPTAIDLSAKKPLDGVQIVLDAGHGGDDNGASGVLRNTDTPYFEKDLNLAITLEAAEKLEKLGADIHLTRHDDTTHDLFERMAFLEENEPDLCVSIHQNSIGTQSDITKIRGTLALWCMDSGYLLADSVGRAVADSTGRNYRGADYQMLAMCRNPKFPSALIETGFITSVEEYEQMTSSDGISLAAEGICQGILNYFLRQASYAII